MRRLRKSLFLAVVILLFAGDLSSQIHLEAYERGFRAMRYDLFNEAAWWFETAAEAEPRPGGTPARLHGRTFLPYLPKYFAGVAYFAAGRFREAEERWKECREELAQLAPESPRAADRFVAMIETYLAFQEARRAALERIDRLYDRTQALPKGRRADHAARAFDMLRDIETRAHFSGEPRDLDRLQGLLVELESLLTDLARHLRSLESTRRLTGRGGFALASYDAASLDRFRQASARSGTSSGSGFDFDDRRYAHYDARYALLISPVNYDDARLRPIPDALVQFTRLKKSLLRSGPEGDPWFDEVVVLPTSLTGGSARLTRRQFEFFLATKLLDRWLAPGRKNLVIIVFAGHACNISSVSIAPLSDSPPCEGAESNIEKKARLSSTSVQARDIYNLLYPNAFYLGDVVMVFDSCHAAAFAEPVECSDWGGGAPLIDAAEKRSAIFVAAGRNVDYVDQVALVEAFADAIDGCMLDRGAEATLTGYELFSAIEQRLATRGQFIQKRRCHAFADLRDGDFVLRIQERCRARWNEP